MGACRKLEQRATAIVTVPKLDSATPKPNLEESIFSRRSRVDPLQARTILEDYNAGTPSREGEEAIPESLHKSIDLKGYIERHGISIASKSGNANSPDGYHSTIPGRRRNCSQGMGVPSGPRESTARPQVPKGVLTVAVGRPTPREVFQRRNA